MLSSRPSESLSTPPRLKKRTSSFDGLTGAVKVVSYDGGALIGWLVKDPLTGKGYATNVAAQRVTIHEDPYSDFCQLTLAGNKSVCHYVKDVSLVDYTKKNQGYKFLGFKWARPRAMDAPAEKWCDSDSICTRQVIATHSQGNGKLRSDSFY